MPRIATHGGIRIYIHFEEINIPHIQTYYDGKIYRFSIKTLRQLASDQYAAPVGYARRIRKLFEGMSGWLLEQWDKCRAGMSPDKLR